MAWVLDNILVLLHGRSSHSANIAMEISRLKDELTSQLKDELTSQIEQTVRDKLKDELRHEIRR